MKKIVLIFVVLCAGCGGGSNRSTSTFSSDPPTQPTDPAPVVTNPPSINPNGGSVSPSQQVSLTDGTSGAKIFFTTDGSTPTVSSQVYAGPLSFQAGSAVIVKALAQAGSMEPSGVVSAAFQVQQPQQQSPFPVFAQYAACGPNTSDTACQHLALTTTAGDCLLEISYLSGTQSVSPVPSFSSDSQGDQFQTLGTEPPNNPNFPETFGVYGAQNIVGGATSFSATVPVATNIFVLEYSNCGGFDVPNAVVEEGVAANQGTEQIFGARNASTSGPNETVISFIAITNESLATVVGNQRIDLSGSTGIVIQDVNEPVANSNSTSNPIGDTVPTFSIMSAPDTGDDVTFATVALIPNSH